MQKRASLSVRVVQRLLVYTYELMFSLSFLSNMLHHRYLYKVRHTSDQIVWIFSGQGSIRCLQSCPVTSQRTDHESHCAPESFIPRTGHADMMSLLYNTGLFRSLLCLAPHRKWSHCPWERKWPGADHQLTGLMETVVNY